MIKIICLNFIFLLSLFAVEKDIKSTDFNLNITKYILVNSIHENLNIRSVDKWYLYITNKNLFSKVKNDLKALNDELNSNYIKLQEDTLKITNELNNNTFFYEKLIRFDDYKNEIKSSDILNKKDYFIVDNSLENSFQFVGRYYINEMPLENKKYRLKEKVDIAYIRYYFKIVDLRLDRLKNGFKEDINSLNLEANIYIKIEKIEFFNLDMKRI